VIGSAQSLPLDAEKDPLSADAEPAALAGSRTPKPERDGSREDQS
jgi:hypothetical protein